jgi:hypothetical protein
LKLTLLTAIALIAPWTPTMAGDVREDLNCEIGTEAKCSEITVGALVGKLMSIAGIEFTRAYAIARCIMDRREWSDGRPIPEDIWNFCKDRLTYERSL